MIYIGIPMIEGIKLVIVAIKCGIIALMLEALMTYNLVNLIHLVPGCCGVVVSTPARKAGDMGLIPVGVPNTIFNLWISWQESVTQLTWGRGKCFATVLARQWTCY